MLPGPSVRSFTILGALMALLAAPLLIAQSPTTAKSSAYGGSTVTTHYNPDGSIYRIETVDAKGVLREVETKSYDSETHSLIQSHADRLPPTARWTVTHQLLRRPRRRDEVVASDIRSPGPSDLGQIFTTSKTTTPTVGIPSPITTRSSRFRHPRKECKGRLVRADAAGHPHSVERAARGALFRIGDARRRRQGLRQRPGLLGEDVHRAPPRR